VSNKPGIVELKCQADLEVEITINLKHLSSGTWERSRSIHVSCPKHHTHAKADLYTWETPQEAIDARQEVLIHQLIEALRPECRREERRQQAPKAQLSAELWELMKPQREAFERLMTPPSERPRNADDPTTP